MIASKSGIDLIKKLDNKLNSLEIQKKLMINQSTNKKSAKRN